MAATLAVLPLTAASAQRLDRVDSLIAAGQYAQARSALLEWQRANPSTANVNAASRARAVFLNARLTEDATQAQELYLSLALTYPTSREAPEALLRLGQGLLAANDYRRAVSYLERLVRDYPTAPNRGEAHLWLARAQLALGTPASACTTATAALRAGFPNRETTELLAAEERNACATPGPNVSPELLRTAPRAIVPADSPRAVPRPVVPVDSPRKPPSIPPPANTRRAAPPGMERTTPPVMDSPGPQSGTDGQFAAQTGAFRNVQSAHAIAAQLKRKGFDARVAYIGNGTLATVRIGRFRTRADAVAEAARAKAAGFSAIIVDDVRRERNDL